MSFIPDVNIPEIVDWHGCPNCEHSTAAPCWRHSSTSVVWQPGSIFFVTGKNKCALCGMQMQSEWYFCPWCGADLKGSKIYEP